MNALREEANRIFRDRLSRLAVFLADESINEIMINRGDRVFIERAGRIEMISIALDEHAIEAAIRAVMSLNEKDVAPIMDARLPGLRIACALPPVSVHGPSMVIRRHSSRHIALDEYADGDAFATQVMMGCAMEDAGDSGRRVAEDAAGRGGDGLAEFLRWAVVARKNIMIVGGTGSGKTTLLKSCLLEVPHSERLITCEDTNEISVAQPNCLQLEAYYPPGGGKAITIRDLVRHSLRCRPDRIIVGEVRGGEAYDMLDAMNTGHSGTLCTLHADSAPLGLRRLESLVRMAPEAGQLTIADIREIIAAAIDYVVHVSRVADRRVVMEVVSVDGVGNGDYLVRELFRKRVLFS